MGCKKLKLHDYLSFHSSDGATEDFRFVEPEEEPSCNSWLKKEASISVNNELLERYDTEGFFAIINANNESSAVFLPINVTAVLFDPEAVPEIGGNQPGNAKGADLIATVSGTVFMPKAEDNPIYESGRLTEDSGQIYSWDFEDNLLSVESRVANAEGKKIKIENTYDYAGRRIRKLVYENGVLTRTHYFYYDQVLLNGNPADFGVLTGETVADSSGTTEYQYFWGLDLNGIYQGLGGIGGLLAIINKSSGKTYLPCMDAKGSIHSYICADSCESVAKYSYDPYGRIIKTEGEKVRDFSLLFQSKYYDWETALYNFGRRYLQSETCKWLSRDVIGESGGLNLYAYCNGDPVNNIDILGCALYAFDGTANVETDRTNVFLMRQAYGGINKEYYRGVGNDIENDAVDATAGKAVGFNYQEILRDAYHDLVTNFKNGDTDIDIIGFSRGGVIAILFAKMIEEKGVPTGQTQQQWDIYGNISYGAVKVRPKIRFLGLFDPVSGPKGFPKPSTISNNVEETAIAYSLHEMRVAFHPLLVTGHNIVQRGFAGGHSDIGGGYINRGLANAPLAWMVSQGRSTGAPFNMPNMANYPELTNKMIPHQEYSMFNISGVEKIYDFDARTRYLPKSLQFDPVPQYINDFYLNFEKQFK